MTTKLNTAFQAGASAFPSIAHIYDYAGFIAMRVMIDGRFMDIDESRFKTPSIALKAAQFYNRANDMAQQKFVNALSDLYAHGNVGPKPDFKKPAISLAGNLAGAIYNNLGRITIGQAAVFALAAGTMIVAASLTGQGTGFITDITSNYLGLKPNSNAAEPKMG